MDFFLCCVVKFEWEWRFLFFLPFSARNDSFVCLIQLTLSSLYIDSSIRKAKNHFHTVIRICLHEKSCKRIISSSSFSFIYVFIFRDSMFSPLFFSIRKHFFIFVGIFFIENCAGKWIRKFSNRSLGSFYFPLQSFFYSLSQLPKSYSEFSAFDMCT